MKLKTTLYLVLEVSDEDQARMATDQIVQAVNDLLYDEATVEAILTYPELYQQVVDQLPSQACRDFGMVDEDDAEALTKEELKAILKAEGVDVWDWADYPNGTIH